MPIGATWYIRFVEMRVDSDRHCYLNAMAKRLAPDSLFTIRVHRGTDGYRVTIENRAIKYTPAKLALTGEMLPVASLTENYISRG
jgi:hypothetical protein